MYQLLTRTDIDEAKVISALQHLSQNSISDFFEKEIIFLVFYVLVLVKTFPLIYQLLK